VHDPRIDDARRHGVAAHIVPTGFAGGEFHQAADRSLGHGGHAVVLQGAEDSSGCEDRDGAPAGALQNRHSAAQDIEGAEHVGLEDAPEVRFVDLEQGHEGNGGTGSRDNVGDRARDPERRVEERGDRVRRRDVDLHRRGLSTRVSYLLDHGLGLRLVAAIADHHGCPHGDAADHGFTQPPGSANHCDHHVPHSAIRCGAAKSGRCMM